MAVDLVLPESIMSVRKSPQDSTNSTSVTSFRQCGRGLRAPREVMVSCDEPTYPVSLVMDGVLLELALFGYPHTRAGLR